MLIVPIKGKTVLRRLRKADVLLEESFFLENRNTFQEAAISQLRGYRS